MPICLFAYGSEGLGVAAAISSLIILVSFYSRCFLAIENLILNHYIKSPPFIQL